MHDNALVQVVCLLALANNDLKGETTRMDNDLFTKALLLMDGLVNAMQVD